MKEAKIIGYEAKRIVANATGLGSYSRTLLESLSAFDKQFLLYAPNEGRRELYSNLLDKSNITFKFPSDKSNNNSFFYKISQNIWREKGIVRDLIRDKVEVFHGLSGQLPLGINKTNIKTVLTIHDLIFMVHPDWYSPIDILFYKRKFFHSVKMADHIIAISECTKRDIIRFAKVKESKIEVIYQSFNPIFAKGVGEEEKQKIRQKYSLPKEFILNVGTIERRKNILLVVKAIKELEQYSNKDIHLVIVGRKTEYTKEISNYIEKNNLQAKIHIINGVLFEELRVIYSMASLFVYPSIYEGFGIPIIEAMANRLPVIACKGSCLEEAGGDYSLYVENNDVKAMAEAINAFLYDNNRREQAIEKGLDHIKKFANNNVAQKHIDLYNSLIQ
ncbi:MAG: glycosyltransferase family 1 protein [Bacteroidota bacterium]|nr:glycosyltransferase family 1 protein [Bacteroidota bacterium]